MKKLNKEQQDRASMLKATIEYMLELESTMPRESDCDQAYRIAQIARREYTDLTGELLSLVNNNLEVAE